MVEFVSTEHTPRNLLIRAVKAPPLPAAALRQAAAEYVALKEFWGVVPHLEALLKDRLPAEAMQAGSQEA